MEAIKLARLRISNELYLEIDKLKCIALLFELMPLKPNRHRIRIFPRSFRGNDAVDYMLLECLANECDSFNECFAK